MFKDNGWIRFQFPSEIIRDTVLNGGPYMIFGNQLFLKKLPRCFLFSKEDMDFILSWVQIFGLPVDFWTTSVLSKIASVVGKPIHTDVLTITKRGANYARVLVEIDSKKPSILDYAVKFTNGKKTTIMFKYEIETKYCDKCKSLGHTMESCGIEIVRGRRRHPPRQRDGKQFRTPATNILKDPLRSDKPEMCSAIPDIVEIKNHPTGADSNNKVLDFPGSSQDSPEAGILPGTETTVVQHIASVDE